jgi:hypothetical protein
LLSIRSSAEASAKDAIAIELPNTSCIQRTDAGGEKLSLV